jgi:UDP-glucuronate decarboxylase
LFFDYWRQHGLAIKIARIFNTYGPRLDPNDGRVISTFIVRALLGHDIPIHGDGSQTRSFCYVDDLIEGLTRFMDSPDRITGPLNMGNPSEISIIELAKLVIGQTGSRSRVVHKERPQDDPRQRRPDVSLAKDLISWTPNIPLKEGLSRTIEYFDDLLSKGMTGKAAE